MLIGIDMLGVQSPEDARGEVGRYGRQLVEALLGRDSDHRYVFYTHDGLSTARVPSSRNASRATLGRSPSPGPAGLRPTTQRLLDQNPDGLDWLILLDPFAPLYGGSPPESPLNGLRIASVVLDLAPVFAEDHRIVPLRRHDAVFAVSDPIAAECRKRLGSAADRVATIDLACDSTFHAPGRSDPLTKVAGDELGRLGISGPFLLAKAGAGANRADLDGILEAYSRLPIEHRRGHQLVVAGAIDDPAAARSYLYDRGCEAGLTLVGEVPEGSLLTLYARCAAFVAPSTREGASLSILEAMRCGAAVVAGRSGWQGVLIGDAGIAVDPADPAQVAAELADLLGDADLGRDLRRKALERSSGFAWPSVIDSVLATLEAPPARRARVRFDRGHVARPRIALFPDVPAEGSARVDLPARVPAALRESYNVDLYLDGGHATLADGLPPEFGGFDARLFDRNDGLLSYHAIAYRVDDAGTLEAKLDRIRRRPGLVLVLDEKWLDLIGPLDGPAPADPRSVAATSRLRELFLTSAHVAVHSPWHRQRIASALPEFADQLAEIPPPSASAPVSNIRRVRARARLDLLPETLVIGQFPPGDDSAEPLLTPSAFRAIAKAVPGALLLAFDRPRSATSKALAAVPKVIAGDRYIQAGPITAADAGDVLAVLDLVIHPGGPGPISLVDLLRAGVATVSPGSDFPPFAVRDVSGSGRGADLARAVRELAADPSARAALGSAARDHVSGIPDPDRAADLWVARIERCAAELPRIPGRKHRRPAEGPRGLAFSPHFSHRQASPSDRAATGRGEQR